jgi:hypothetical protein
VAGKNLMLVLAIMLSSLESSVAASYCETVTTIANDAERMKYAKEWLTSRLSDPKFRQSIRKRHAFHHGDDRAQQFGAPDWSYLGFPDRHATLEFNMPIKNAAWDISRVHSASLCWGRYCIIIKLGPADDLGLSWSAEHVAKLKGIRDDVYVACLGD